MVLAAVLRRMYPIEQLTLMRRSLDGAHTDHADWDDTPSRSI
jgi:hypothetical protein